MQNVTTPAMINAVVVNKDGQGNILSIRKLEVQKPFIPWGNQGHTSLHLEGSIGYEVYKDRATA